MNRLIFSFILTLVTSAALADLQPPQHHLLSICSNRCLKADAT